ncbi:MAG: hypothetical protein QOG53_3605 [Frankiales bacterium]|nr:hypothetical protein [Frankiales bacterium]
MARLRNLLIRLRGGEPLPAGVTMPLERRERILTWGRVRGGAIAAATDVGLRIVGPDHVPTLHRWHEIARAVWDDGALEVEGTDRTVVRYRMPEPRGVPAAVREHVTATVVVSVRHEIGAGVGIRAVARRNLSTGELVWSAVPDRGLDPGDPQIRAQGEALVERVRRRYAGERGQMI